MADCISSLAPDHSYSIGYNSDTQSPCWLAVYVKHRHEKTVALHLQKNGYEAFLPLYLRARQHSKRSELPLFPGYVFCRSELKKTMAILKLPGVFSIVGFGSTPASVPDQEIEGLKRVLRFELKLQPWTYIAPGEQICFQAGPLRGLEAVVLDADHETWVIVSVHLLRRSVAVKVDRSFLTRSCL